MCPSTLPCFLTHGLPQFDPSGHLANSKPLLPRVTAGPYINQSLTNTYMFYYMLLLELVDIQIFLLRERWEVRRWGDEERERERAVNVLKRIRCWCLKLGFWCGYARLHQIVDSSHTRSRCHAIHIKHICMCACLPCNLQESVPIYAIKYYYLRM